MSLPTFLFYKDGTEVKRLSGEDITKNQIRETIEEMIEA
jgi:thiol-disulfide isomerase/thioredoxin